MSTENLPELPEFKIQVTDQETAEQYISLGIPVELIQEDPSLELGGDELQILMEDEEKLRRLDERAPLPKFEFPKRIKRD